MQEKLIPDCSIQELLIRFKTPRFRLNKRGNGLVRSSQFNIEETYGCLNVSGPIALI